METAIWARCIISQDLKSIPKPSLSFKAVRDQGLFLNKVSSNPLCVNKILRKKKVPRFAGILWNPKGQLLKNKVMRPF